MIGFCSKERAAIKEIDDFLILLGSCQSCFYLVLCKAVSCKAPLRLSVSKRLSDGGNFAEFPFWQFMCFFDPQSLQVFSAANFILQFEKTIAGKLFGLCLKGAAATKKVKVLPPSAPIASISIRCKKLSVARRFFNGATGFHSGRSQGSLARASCRVFRFSQRLFSSNFKRPLHGLFGLCLIKGDGGQQESRRHSGCFHLSLVCEFVSCTAPLGWW